MGKSEREYVWCTCSLCLRHGPDGIIQTVRTHRAHALADSSQHNNVSLPAPHPPVDLTPSMQSGGFIESSLSPSHVAVSQLSSSAKAHQLDSASDIEEDFFDPLVASEVLQNRSRSPDQFQWHLTDRDHSLPRRSQSRTFCFSSDSEDESDADCGVLPTHTTPYESSEDEDTQSNSDPESDPEDLTTDPLFCSRSSIFEAFQSGDKSALDDENSEPWAFDDHPAIRNAYIRAFVGAAFDGMTRNAVVNMLNGSRVILESAAAAGVDFPGLANFTRTLPTVENRCTKQDCSGSLYTVKRLSNGSEKRIPVLTLPFVPPEKALQRMCLQPGKVAQWQEWRGPLDSVGQRYAAFPDPDKPMSDISDGWGWRAIQAGLERRRNGSWEIRDVDVSELKQQFVALPNGLVVQININWFQAVKGACHSTGAIDYTMGFFSMYMERPSHNPSIRIHVQIATDVSDLPASRKTSELNRRDPWRYLKYAFRARDASAEVAEEISRRRGVRFSVMDDLVNWLPGVTGLFDMMHCIFGTMIKHLCKNILYKNGMIDTEGAQKLEEFMSKLIWPSSISRLPPSVARGAGSIKADQWRSHITVFFVGLFMAWQVNGEIPDIDAPPSPPNTKNAAAQAAQEKLVRSRMLEHLMATNPNPTQEEIDEIKNVTMNLRTKSSVDAVHSNGQRKNGLGCTAILFQEQLLKHGPAPGCWAFAYERNNGLLGRFNHNGHSGGEMEGTMMRGWWKATLIQDLISRLEAIPNRGPEDADSLALLKSYLKGGTSERKGTLQNYISMVQTKSNPDEVQFPRFPQTKILRELGPGYFNLVFTYLKQLWSPEITVLPDVSSASRVDEISFSGDVESFSHVWVRRRRYGAAQEHRGQSAQYAYIDARVPVRIQHIFRVQHKLVERRKLVAAFAIIQRFRPSTTITDFPWDLW
ncbi:hypothetical protein FB451DRAFT_1172268 [Mycena latifolia]|nr:hypothetical protein FB451DRAFT_1172268 [Mycena latifolia]